MELVWSDIGDEPDTDTMNEVRATERKHSSAGPVLDERGVVSSWSPRR